MRWLPLTVLGVALTTAVQAQSTVNEDFEDGSYHGDPTAMQVKPQILTEGSNRFLRITGSSGDCDAMPSHLCPPRNRSTVRFTSPFSSMPAISPATMRQTYQAQIRFHDDHGIDGSVLELFQDGPQTGGYATRDGQGPVVRLWRENGRVNFTSLYANETKMTTVARTVRSGAWHTYQIVAVWSHDPAVGRLELSFDGTRVLTVSGRDVNLGPTSSRIPELKLGLYGDYATGRIDVDEIHVFPTGGSVPPPSSPPPGAGPVAPPTPPTPLPRPKNFRVVAQ